MTIRSKTSPLWRYFAIIAASILFFVLGSLHTAYGPALPGLITRSFASEQMAGWLPSSHFIGAVLGIGGTIRIGRHVAFQHTLLGFGCVVLLGAAGLMIFSSWAAMFLSAGLVGMGSGGLQVEIVGWLGNRYATRPRMALSLVHAFLSLGFVWGPVGVAISPARRPFTVFFITVLVGMVALGALLRSLDSSPASLGGREEVFRLPQGVRLMALLFVFYVGLEIGIGTWEPTHLVAEGATDSEAARLTALFWGAFSLSRIVAGLLPQKIQDYSILLGGLGGASLVLSAAYWLDVLVPAYALAGILLGPVFPAGLAWVSTKKLLSTSSTAVLLLGSMSGGILFPPLMGFLIGSYGAQALPLIMSIIAAICCVILIIGTSGHQRSRPAATGKG